jgi:isoquinoline 1-oxidoreductase subunit beta
MKRRTILLAGLGGAGALVVGWGLMPPRSRLGGAELFKAEGSVALNGWIRITPEGRVQLAMPRSEMGQGVHTALAQMVAEELNVTLAQVELAQAGHDAIYGNVAMLVASVPVQPEDSEPGAETRSVRTGRWIVGKLARELGINATGGSSSVADAYEPTRLAAATARGQLLGAAALRWKQSVDELTISDGVVRHAAGGHQAHYGELVKEAANAPPGAVKLKPRSEWKLAGTAAPRTDAFAKSSGNAGFGIDVRQHGQLFAVIRHAPALGGHPAAVNDSAAMQLPGVERVVRVPSYAGSTPALAVVGRTTWHAKRGADALEVQWRGPPAGGLNSASILADLEVQAKKGEGLAFHDQGDAMDMLAKAGGVIEAVYRAPYLAHATMEPMNCTAQVMDGKVTVWAPTQVPGFARDIAARVAGVPKDDVTVIVTYLGGGFGRRLEVDFVAQAVRVAMECNGRPVQLLWTREEDTTHDYYRPAGVAVARAALGTDGKPQALAIHSAGDAITPRWMERGLPAMAGPVDTPDKTAAEGLFDLPYSIAHQRMTHTATRSGVPIGFWRAVGHSHNAFFSECFIDELAHAAKQDPVAYRMSMLDKMPRHAAVLKLAAEKSGWGSPLPAGREKWARGVALHESFDSIVAEVVEISLEGNTPRVHRVVVAIDCGVVINPGIVAQQMESGVVFGLTAALHSRIDIENSIVKQRNFPDYPMVGMKDAPVVETHIVPSERHPGGVGEVAVPPLAPALGNALFTLTGKRLRDLPLALG